MRRGARSLRAALGSYAVAALAAVGLLLLLLLLLLHHTGSRPEGATVALPADAAWCAATLDDGRQLWELRAGETRELPPGHYRLTLFDDRGGTRQQDVDLDRGCVVTERGATLPPSATSDVVCSPAPGASALLMSFPELRQYSRLQISRDATIPYVLGAAILIVLGLLPALYVSRRKVWVRARPDGPGSIVQVGGFALQRKDRFDEEFANLVDGVVAAAGGATVAEPAEVVRP